MKCPKGHEMYEVLGEPILDSLMDVQRGSDRWYCRECGFVVREEERE